MPAITEYAVNATLPKISLNKKSIPGWNVADKNLTQTTDGILETVGTRYRISIEQVKGMHKLHH